MTDEEQDWLGIDLTDEEVAKMAGSDSGCNERASSEEQQQEDVPSTPSKWKADEEAEDENSNIVGGQTTKNTHTVVIPLRGIYVPVAQGNIYCNNTHENQSSLQAISSHPLICLQCLYGHKPTQTPQTM